jgi:hypothetical protein
MNGKWPASLLLSLMTFATDPGGQEVRTVHGSILCATPFQLRKAIVAARRDDGRRIAQLGCVRTGAGVTAVLLAQPVAGFGPWQIRLSAEGMPPLTLWGYASSFQTDAADQIASDSEAR